MAKDIRAAAHDARPRPQMGVMDFAASPAADLAPETEAEIKGLIARTLDEHPPVPEDMLIATILTAMHGVNVTVAELTAVSERTLADMVKRNEIIKVSCVIGPRRTVEYYPRGSTFVISDGLIVDEPPQPPFGFDTSLFHPVRDMLMSVSNMPGGGAAVACAIHLFCPRCGVPKEGHRCPAT